MSMKFKSKYNNFKKWMFKKMYAVTDSERNVTRRTTYTLTIWCQPSGELPWWRYQMEILSSLLVLCAGNSPVTGEFPAQRPVTRSFDIFFDLCLNKGMSKQSWGWWFDTPSHSLWRHCNALVWATRTFTFLGVCVYVPVSVRVWSWTKLLTCEA